VITELIVQQKAGREDVDSTDDDTKPLIMTTLRNEKYQCVYVPEGADEVCTYCVVVFLIINTGL